MSVNQAYDTGLLDSQITVPFVAVCSFMRSGTHLTIDTLRKNFPVYDLKRPLFGSLDAHYISIDVLLRDYKCPQSVKTRELKKALKNRCGIIKTHFAAPGFVDLKEQEPLLKPLLRDQCRTIYVVRNPVRVLQSLYIFESSYRSVSPIDKWIRESAKRWDEHVRGWTGLQGILVIRFEDLLSDPANVLGKIAAFLELRPVPNDDILPCKLKSRLLAWLGRLHLKANESTEIRAALKSTRLDPATRERISKTVEALRLQSAIQFGYKFPDE